MVFRHSQILFLTGCMLLSCAAEETDAERSVFGADSESRLTDGAEGIEGFLTHVFTDPTIDNSFVINSGSFRGLKVFLPKYGFKNILELTLNFTDAGTLRVHGSSELIKPLQLTLPDSLIPANVTNIRDLYITLKPIDGSRIVLQPTAVSTLDDVTVAIESWGELSVIHNPKPDFSSMDDLPGPQKPYLYNPFPAIDFEENGEGAFIASRAELFDPDQHDDGSHNLLSVWVSDNADMAYDRLEIDANLLSNAGIDFNTQDKQLVRSDSNEVIAGVAQSLRKFIITFNENGRRADIERVLHAIYYKYSGTTFRTSTRVIKVKIKDQDRYENDPGTGDVTVYLRQQNSGPRLLDLDGQVFRFNVAAHSGITLYPQPGAADDPDYRGGGSLSLDVISGKNAGDSLSILPWTGEENHIFKIQEVSGKIWVGQTAVGQLTYGDDRASMRLDFNNQATMYLITRILKRIAFTCEEDSAGTMRKIRYRLTDEHGAASPDAIVSVDVFR